MKFLLPFCLLLLLISGCSDDEQPLPNYQEELADLPTDGAGRAAMLVMDNGETLPLDSPINGLKADTTYRILSLLVRNKMSVHLADFASILSLPVKRYKQENPPTDAVCLVSCWQTGRYINLHLQIMGTTTGVHYFGVQHKGVSEGADGSRILQARLIHQRNKDPQHYSRETYLSVPLTPLRQELTAGRDSFWLAIPCADGDKVCKFLL